MKKKLLLLIPIVLVLALFALVVYWNPSTREINIQLNTYKIDRNCNVKGTFPIELTGHWIDPLFEDTRLDITASEFDGLFNLEVTPDSDTFSGAVPHQLPGLSLLEVQADVFNRSKNHYEFCSVVFSPDQERWMLAFSTNDAFYLGSTNSDDTLEDLYDYFMPVIIGSWPGDPNEKDMWQYFGQWVTSEGISKETVDLKVKNVLQKAEGNREVLTLYFDAPKDFPYRFPVNGVYCDESDTLPYCTISGQALNSKTEEAEPFHLAYDKEKNWSVIAWENDPTKYLILAGKPQFDTHEILEHFNDFLNDLIIG